MSIAKGDKLPEGKLLKLGANGPEEVAAADLAQGLVAIFAVPGAYTPTCTNAHMPSFVKSAGNFRDKGVSRLVCITVNDPFVAGKWAADTGATDAGIEVLADADGSFTKALGMNIQGAGWINGRSKRYAMLVNDGTIEELQVEEAPSACSVSSGESLLELV
ncbi:peroxiredoxin [Paracoccus sp. P2]|uniref:Glutathione-dependent peroxiredoxin n=1 Tax=Paracoccus pantotrophus TaxID=82367 RepID=A0A1I5H6Z4_PARPN|nr:peroxiredoxin [Paracoccus pantotrophus]MDF3854639.1 peroxiredoxin [Paracoccus pantotrophus]QFG38115.1 peroxiredoxin [Paracoccus pantotrophus]QLH15655.1 peroxiredoxin [Paracoccus pantotrophus]RDE00850.1 peroxiredoxin [Paracoccus pantotrophus]RKS51383.1 cytochrome c peroxidase [Paracoccus pantotrophus]